MNRPKVFIILGILLLIAAGSLIYRYSKDGSISKNNDPKPLPVVRVGVVTWAGIGPGYVGIEKGFFEGIKVEMRVLEDTTARYAAYASGDLGLMLTTADQHSREVERGLPGKLFLITDLSNGADGMIASSKIKNINDLKGKRIAYPVGTASDYLLHKVLEKAGLKQTDVTLRTVDDPNNAIAAFNSGQVDAAVAWEPLLTEASASGKAHILATSADIPGAIVTLFVAQDNVTQNSTVAQAFLSGWIKSVDFMKSNPEEASAIVAKGLNIKPDEVKGMMSGIKIGDNQLNKSYFCHEPAVESQLASLVMDSARYWKSTGALHSLPVASERLSQASRSYFCIP